MTCYLRSKAHTSLWYMTAKTRHRRALQTRKGRMTKTWKRHCRNRRTFLSSTLSCLTSFVTSSMLLGVYWFAAAMKPCTRPCWQLRNVEVRDMRLWIAFALLPACTLPNKLVFVDGRSQSACDWDTRNWEDQLDYLPALEISKCRQDSDSGLGWEQLPILKASFPNSQSMMLSSL